MRCGGWRGRSPRSGGRRATASLCSRITASTISPPCSAPGGSAPSPLWSMCASPISCATISPTTRRKWSSIPMTRVTRCAPRPRREPSSPARVDPNRGGAARPGRRGRLRFALSGGGPVPPSLKRAFRDELKIPLVESYGQSELGGFVALGYPELEPDDARLAPIGPPPPDKEVIVCDLDDRPLRHGETGELCLRGGFMAGYWNRPEQTARATRGGLLRTGDVGFLDADGNVTLRGRRSELIEVKGVTWFPRDIEEALQRIPGVK